MNHQQILISASVFLIIPLSHKNMEEKEDICLEFLEEKCNEYLQHLICIGTKLAKKGKFDEESFSQTFFPKRDFVLRKIREQAKAHQKVEKAPSKTSCLDSQLIDEIRALCLNYEKDLCETFKSNDESPKSSDFSMQTAKPCESPAEKAPKEKIKKPKANDVKCDEFGDSHFLTQELNYGELSKIFVQKSRVDVVRSKMDKPDFEDHLETIYVYRTRPSCHEK